MPAHRRISPAGKARLRVEKAAIKRIPHAVQPLELEPVQASRRFENGRHCQCVMCCKLRVQPWPRLQQPFGACDIIQIRHRLPGKHRIILKPAFLRPLHFRVPIGPLDEPHHHRPAKAPCERIDPVDHRQRTLLVGLNGEAEPAPPCKRRIGKHRCNHVKREFQPVRLFGIHREIQIIRFRLPRQIEQNRHKLRHHPLPRHPFISRMQRRQLHRNPRTLRQCRIARSLPDRINRIPIGLRIAFRILLRARTLAEHVKRIAEQTSASRPRAVERLANRLAQHKMAPENPHRLPCCAPHRRQTETLHHGRENSLGRLAGPDHPRRNPERPCRR